MNFTKTQIEQINTYGLTEEKVRNQINTFICGIPFAEIDRPASAGDGICVLSKNNQEELAQLFDKSKTQLQLVKFVPASGAATRMFEALHIFIENFNPEKETLTTFFRKNHLPLVEEFLENKEQF